MSPLAGLGCAGVVCAGALENANAVHELKTIRESLLPMSVGVVAEDVGEKMKHVWGEDNVTQRT
jgi:homoserine kinase